MGEDGDVGCKGANGVVMPESFNLWCSCNFLSAVFQRICQSAKRLMSSIQIVQIGDMACQEFLSKRLESPKQESELQTKASRAEQDSNGSLVREVLGRGDETKALTPAIAPRIRRGIINDLKVKEIYAIISVVS